MILEQVLWLSALGALLALDAAMVGQFMIAQPLVVGGIFGYLLGDVSSGLMIGAMIQLLWLGVLPVGAYVPSDHTVTGGITTGLAILLMQKCGLAFGPSLVLAFGIAIPAGVLSGKLDVLVRHVNSRIAGWGERAAEKYGSHGIAVLNGIGLFGSFLRNFIIYLVWFGPLSILLVWGAPQIPEPVLRAFGAVYWVLPMLSLAVILEIVAKTKAYWMISSVFLITWTLLFMWSGQAGMVFCGVMVLGASLMWWRRAW
jgi:fructoselysine/glucoselysine PTS system EIIC component